jgi:hypothetical protein
VSLKNGSSWPSRPRTGARSKRRLGWQPVRKDNIGAQQEKAPAHSAEADTTEI